MVVVAAEFGSTGKLAMESYSLSWSFTCQLVNLEKFRSKSLHLLPPLYYFYRPKHLTFAIPAAPSMAFRKTVLRALALPKASTGFGGRSSQGSHTITVFGATGMTGKKAIVM